MTDTIIYDPHASYFSSWKVELIASGFQFTEGPVWHPGGYLLFSDIPANKIFRLDPGGSVTIYLEKSGFNDEDASHLSDMIGSNGLAWDKNNNLIICQHGNHAIACLDASKNLGALTDTYEGRPFNSPNDLAVSADGSIYFTDPPYGLKDQVVHPSLFQTDAGLYRYNNGNVTQLTNDLRYPNGVCFSPGEEFLYLGSNHPDEPYLWEYTLSAEGAIKERSVLIVQNADGIKTDDEGRLFLATDKGVLILSPRGKRLALIPLPESPSNLAWGGTDSSELYITARSGIYRIKKF
jgi:gluconolactonase